MNGKTARAILDSNGDYLLQIKENRATILRNAKNVAKARNPNGIKKSRAEPQKEKIQANPDTTFDLDMGKEV